LYTLDVTLNVIVSPKLGVWSGPDFTTTDRLEPLPEVAPLGLPAKAGVAIPATAMAMAVGTVTARETLRAVGVVRRCLAFMGGVLSGAAACVGRARALSLSCS
jgi:hypothetical protein